MHGCMDVLVVYEDHVDGALEVPYLRKKICRPPEYFLVSPSNLSESGNLDSRAPVLHEQLLSKIIHISGGSMGCQSVDVQKGLLNIIQPSWPRVSPSLQTSIVLFPSTSQGSETTKNPKMSPPRPQ
jgi:hypothetical protein